MTKAVTLLIQFGLTKENVEKMSLRHCLSDKWNFKAELQNSLEIPRLFASGKSIKLKSNNERNQSMICK